MQTSASCPPEARRRSRSRPRPPRGGYTLLEVLVVMVLVGLLTALAVPQLQRVVDSVEATTRRKTVLADIAGLGYRAYVLGQGFELSPAAAARMLRDGSPVLALPAGWQIATAQPIVYSFSGFCSGGDLTLQEPDGAVWRLQLRSPLCRVVAAAP